MYFIQNCFVSRSLIPLCRRMLLPHPARSHHLPYSALDLIHKLSSQERKYRYLLHNQSETTDDKKNLTLLYLLEVNADTLAAS
jgi:hypothetical protein